MKKWVVLNNQARHITEKEIISILLKNRGITRKKEIEKFLNPSLDTISFKELNLNKKKVDKAVKRIKKAIKNKESVVVYTDYDVDGLTGGAIVWETLYEFGAKVMPYIPHRLEEGYGLSQKGIDKIKRDYQVTLLITVDHGISSEKLVEYAGAKGIETIIIDHHVLPKKLPKAYAIIHTTEVAAGALSWYFCNYLKSCFTSVPLNKLLHNNLDLAALATIADMIPIKGINRTIVKFGLQQLNKTKRIGLKALIKDASIGEKEIGVYEVGRIIAPRINAMGRLTHALDALRLICTRDEDRAKNLAQILGNVNKERQILTEKTTSHAINSANLDTDNKLIFVADESYQQGIIGLVAGKLADQFARPAIVISKGIEYSKASARSVNGINILEIIRQSSDLLIDAGGHPMAAGFTIATRNLEKFQKRTEKLISSILKSKEIIKEIKIDMELSLINITNKLYQTIQILAPFGLGNSEPVFITQGMKIINASLVGKNRQHLKLKLLNNNKNDTIGTIGFNLGDIYTKLRSDTLVDIVYTIDKDDWNGNVGLQLKLKDVKIAD